MLKGFVAYSKTDSSDVDRLMVHLKSLEHEALIETWHDRQISPGEEWNTRIREELEAADVIIFCVSADLLATDYVQKIEIPNAIKRHDHREATVIPVILRRCAWEGNPFLGKLQGIPAKGRTVQDYVRNDDVDDVWTTVADAVREAVRSRRSRHETPSESSDSPERDVPLERDVPPEWVVPDTWVQLSGAEPVILAGAGVASDLDHGAHSTFAIILHYFEASLKNVKAANPNCDTRLRKLPDDAFEASISMGGQRLSFCGVFIQNREGSEDIGYSISGANNRSSMGESLILAQKQMRSLIKWEVVRGGSIIHTVGIKHATGVDTSQMDPVKAASYLWSLFVGQL